MPSCNLESRRSIALLGCVLVYAVLTACASSSGMTTDDRIAIRVSVVDQEGKPVEFATVGRTTAPDPSARIVSMDEEDLRRVLERNRAAWEYWNDYNRPVHGLLLVGITDAGGHVRFETTYSGGEVSRGIDRPASFPLSFGVYRSGYKPAYKSIEVKAETAAVDFIVQLERDPEVAQTLSQTMRSLHEARREISNPRANEDITMENHLRLKALRAKLEYAAVEAKNDGDSSAAAMISYWIGMVPRINLVSDRPNGYTQFDEHSEETLSDFEAAARYDPENDQIVSQWLVHRNKVLAKKAHRNEITDEQWSVRRREILNRALELDERSGMRLWPNFHEMIAYTYGYFKDCENKLRKLRWLQEFEPRYRDYSESIRATKESFGNPYFCRK